MEEWRSRTFQWGTGYHWSRRSALAGARDLSYLGIRLLLRIGEMIAVIMALFIVIICCYLLTDAQIVVHSADLPREIEKLAPENNNKELDFKALKTINEDVIGWIRVDGTGINYPILQGGDNDYYLARNYKKEWATAGSVFLDYRNAADFSDLFSVLYGHRMGYGKMFSDVTKFSDRNYFDAHTGGELYVGDSKYQLRTVAFALISAVEQKVYDVEHSKNNISTVDLIFKEAKYRNDIEGDRYLLLSTCDAQDRGKRDVLLMLIGL